MIGGDICRCLRSEELVRIEYYLCNEMKGNTYPLADTAIILLHFDLRQWLGLDGETDCGAVAAAGVDLLRWDFSVDMGGFCRRTTMRCIVRSIAKTLSLVYSPRHLYV